MPDYGVGSPDDFGAPGYFSSNLVGLVHCYIFNQYSHEKIQSTGIRVELTSTRRAALHRYTFPPNSTEPRIVVDITNDGQRSSTNPFMNIDPDTGHVIGNHSLLTIPIHIKTSTCRRGGVRWILWFGTILCICLFRFSRRWVQFHRSNRVWELAW